MKDLRYIDIMRLLATTITFLYAFGMFAQDGSATVKEHSPQDSTAVIETEKGLDEKIKVLNEKLKNHTVLFRQKIKALPAKTVLYKGKEADGECQYYVENDYRKGLVDQLSPENNCIKIEVFDFQDSEWGKSDLGWGSRAKNMTVFYAGGSTGTADPMKEDPREVTRIVFNGVNVNFKENTVNYVNILDGAPASANEGQSNELGGTHDEKIEIYYKNGFPSIWIDVKNEVESVSEKGVGKYSLKNVENTKTNPIRNTFKKSFFVKNLDYFHKLFTNVADTNERYSLKKYKESNEYMKSTLKY
jgi:hypothetical protein